MELNEEVVETEEIYVGRILRLEKNKVRLPDGSFSQRDVVRHNGAVCIVPVLDDGTVLLVRQFRLPAAGILLEAPAGTREPNEEPSACALRELEEETGYKAGQMEALGSFYVAPGYCTEVIYAFLATQLTATEAHTDADENVEVVRLPLAEVEKMVLGGEIRDAKTIASVLMALPRLREKMV